VIAPVSAPRPTRQGALVGAATLFLFVAAINTGANLLFLLLGASIATFAWAWLVSGRVLSRIEVELTLPDLVEAAAPFTAEMTVDGLGSATVNARADLFLPAGGVLADAAARVAFDAVAPARSRIDGLEIELTSRWPLHLFERRRRLLRSGPIDVHPRLGARRADSRRRRLAGERDAARMGQDGSLRELRDYIPGDSPRRVHWPSSARAGTLVVRESHDTERPEVRITIDTGRPEGPGFERMLEAAASRLRDAIADGHPVTLESPEVRLALTGKDGLRAGLRHLARVMARGAGEAPS